jgi:hypothetical protein
VKGTILTLNVRKGPLLTFNVSKGPFLTQIQTGMTVGMIMGRRR